MKNIKNRKIVAIIVAILLVLFVSWKTNITIADSGFDTDYDFDFGGGYDYDYDYDYGSSYSSSSGGSIDCFDVIILLVIVIIVIIYTKAKNNSNGNNTNTNVNTSIPKVEVSSGVEEEIRKYISNFDRNKFFEDTFTIYKDVQNAWMNFELDKVRDVLTDELYNMYSSQVDTLKIKGQQNIMKDFKLLNAKLAGFNVQNDIAEITAKMTIEFYDYIIDQATNNVLRGSNTSKVTVQYEMTFIKSIKDEDNITLCPNCGAKIEGNSSTVCSYCNSTIVKENTRWVLSKKRNIAQR